MRSKMAMVAVIGAARLARARALGGGGGTTEATCEIFCQPVPSPVEPCKDFARALPRPKMGRTCAQKFGEGWAFACPLMCSSLVNGEDVHPHHWLERLTQSSCQEMSGHIPYPAVFNSCKTGYRSGFTAATAAVSKQFKQRRRPDATQDSPNYHWGNTVQPQLEQEDENEIKPRATISRIAAEAEAQAVTPESEHNLREDVNAWMENLDTRPEYVDYASVAQERVSASRRTRGSDLKRGPACPVCSG